MRRREFGGVVVALLIGAALALIGTPSAVGAATAGDGTTQGTAAASCWAIKQSRPTAPSGTYWLQTPALVAPQQFYCDQTTDGGGWVLVGRGREGWTFRTAGQGSPSMLTTAPDGTSAFAPAALSSPVIDKLLNMTSPAALPDGIRLRRAISANGAVRQEIRWKPLASMNQWSWAFGGRIGLSSMSVDGTTYQGSNTGDTMADGYNQPTNGLLNVNDARRVYTWPWNMHDFYAGFGLGLVSGGSSSASNYLWQKGTEGNPIGFTQVWLRPRFTTFSYPAIPAAGLSAEPVPALLKTVADNTGWGVVGMDHTGEATTEPWRSPVGTMRRVGSALFVGGRFTGVQHGESATPIPRKYLAKFDAATGAYISSFAPTLDGRVWDIQQVDSSRIIIAGDFTKVNGVARTAGLAMINVNTGAVDSTWRVNVSRPGSSERAVVRSVDVSGGYLYIVGNFSQIQGGSGAAVWTNRAAKVALASGNTVTAWLPAFSGTAFNVSVSPDGARAYVSGNFTSTNGNTAYKSFASVSTTNGALTSGMAPFTPSPTPPYNRTYQYASVEVNGQLYLGGSEHTIQMYNRSNMALQASHIAKLGGDFQALAVMGGMVYGSCHCGHWIYHDSKSWPIPTGFSRVDPLNQVGAFALGTLKYVREWQPELRSGTGDGPWALEPDGNGCLWIGGDLDRSANVWLGNFGRFCPADSTPPATPTSVVATPTGTSVNLTWAGGYDSQSSVQFWVYRDNRVVGVTTNRSFTDAPGIGSHTYWVRAVDANGNRSATQAGALAAVGTNPLPVIAAGSNWRYTADGADPGATWASPAFNDRAWPVGKAQLGYGDGDEATTFVAGAVTSYFRRTITVTNPSLYRSLALQLKRDDGAVVYVNGVEVARTNMPEGSIGNATSAYDWIWGDAEAEWLTFRLPNVLVAGANTISVGLHQKGSGNADASFDLALTAVPPGSDRTAPSAPAVSVSATTATSVTLQWPAATDNVAVAGYYLTRNGQPWRYVGANTSIVSDSPVATGKSVTYTVAAFDADGNVSTPVTVSATPR